MSRLLQFWRDYAQRYRWVYLAGVGFLIATNLLTVSIPKFAEEAIDALEKGQGTGSAVFWAIAVLLSGLTIIVVRTLSRTLFFNPGRTIEFRVKNSLFERLLDLPQRSREQVSPGDLISRGTNDTNAVRALIGFGGLALFNTTLLLAFTLVQMLITDPLLTLMCVTPLALSAFALLKGVRMMWKLIIQIQQQMAALSDTILETYNGVGVVHAFDGRAGVEARFDEANQRMLDLGLNLSKISSFLLPIVSVTGSACVVIVLWVGGTRVVEGDALTIGALQAFVGYITIMVTGLSHMGWGFNSIQRGYVSLGRIFEVLRMIGERPAASAEMPATTEGGYPLAVRGLTWSYPDSEAVPDGHGNGGAGPTLEDISFEVSPGSTLGIFGMTGSGKSTLLDLLARVYEPPPGTVTLAGVDVRELPVQDYWRRVSYVPQEAFLFSRSIRDNIALSAPSAGEIDDDQVAAAAADACLSDDLDALPEGLQTEVGERGITLSGGQRQRTALARAFYRSFDLLLLDDVLSAVDHATEQRLIEAIYRRGQGSTMVVVSHRVSVLARADVILVLDGGRVVDRGTHDELITREGVYSHAWRLQKAAEAVEAGDETSPEVRPEAAHG